MSFGTRMQLPNLLSTASKPTRLDQEMQEFKKKQLNAMLKALTSLEAPIKDKHVRTLLIGSYRFKTPDWYFQTLVDAIPLHGDELIVWKITILLHKLFFEGHPDLARKSVKWKNFLLDLGKTWRHIGTGYGTLIHKYTNFLVKKIDLHFDNESVLSSGNFAPDLNTKEMEDRSLVYQLTVEILDYQDLILKLMNGIIHTFEIPKFNSVLSSAQCRLNPLVTCIVESKRVLDVLSTFLAKLYKELDEETLDGHIERFKEMYLDLKSIYYRCETMKYLQGLVNIPKLSEQIPSFKTWIPENDMVNYHFEAKLLALSGELDVANSRTMELESRILELNEDKALLKTELAHAKDVLFRQKAEFSESFEIYKKRQEEEKEELRKSLVQFPIKETPESLSINNEENDKFVKLKDMYLRLRKEHIDLLRKNEELSKSFDQSRDDGCKEADTLKQKIFEFISDPFLRAQISDDIQDVNVEKRESFLVLDDCLQALKEQIEQKSIECEDYRIKNQTMEKDLLDETNRNLKLSTELSNVREKFDELNLKFTYLKGSKFGLEPDDEFFPLDQKENLIKLLNRGQIDFAEFSSEAKTMAKCLTLKNEEFGTSFLSSLLIAAAAASKGYRDSLFAKVSELVLLFLTGDECVISFETALSELTEEDDGKPLEEVEALEVIYFRTTKEMKEIISNAPDTINQLLMEVQSNYSGTELESVCKIIESGCLFMKRVKELILVAFEINEAVSVNEGYKNLRDFFKKNPVNTRCGISIAKSVITAVNLFLEIVTDIAREKLTSRYTKLIAATQGIFSVLASLIISCRIENPDIEKTDHLNTKIKLASESMSSLISTCKDNSKIHKGLGAELHALTSHQAKCFEMEKQAKILELECDLEREREKLSEFRRVNYKPDY